MVIRKGDRVSVRHAVVAAVIATAALGLGMLLAGTAHAQLPAPVAAETFNAEPVEGTVASKCKGDDDFTEFTEAEQFEIGCVIDATEGTVAITTATGDGDETQTADFWDGRFKVTQGEGSEATVVKLRGKFGDGETRELWGEGTGDFTTEGNRGAASVRSTEWLVEDLEDGNTRITVNEGEVDFFDEVLGVTVTVKAGETYTTGQGSGAGTGSPVQSQTLDPGNAEADQYVEVTPSPFTPVSNEPPQATPATEALPFTGLSLGVLVGAGVLFLILGAALAAFLGRREAPPGTN